jgi:L-fuconolactonase
VSATIVVQTIPDETETVEFLAGAEASAGLIAGVVGWVDLTAIDLTDRIAALRAGSGGDHLVGLRHQAQDEPDPGWLSRPAVRAGIRRVGAAGLAFDLLVRPSQMRAAIDVAMSLPEVRFVLDHLGKPDIAAGDWEPWASYIAALASLPNVTVKLSGLVTQARWHGWDVATLRPYAQHAIDLFGPGRTMFGSDWPVCTVAADYAQVHTITHFLTDHLTLAEQAEVWGGSATATYRLDGTQLDPRGYPRSARRSQSSTSAT